MTELVIGLAMLVWNLAGWGVVAAAVVLTASGPKDRYVHGWWSKAWRILAVVELAVHIGHLLIPFGAVWVIATRPRGKDDRGIELARARGPRLPE